MIREGLRRLVRAACAALDEDTVVIIGSQSILGSFGDFMLPAAATISVEPDLLPFDDLDESKADQIDGLLGADSYFASKYGIYADGVSAWTAHLPAGWHQRLVRFDDPESGSVGLCLHPEDLCVAKLLAGRPGGDRQPVGSRTVTAQRSALEEPCGTEVADDPASEELRDGTTGRSSRHDATRGQAAAHGRGSEAAGRCRT